MRLLIMKSPPYYTYYLVPLRPRYLPEQRILRHPQPVFVLHCERLSFFFLSDIYNPCKFVPPHS